MARVSRYVPSLAGNEESMGMAVLGSLGLLLVLEQLEVLSGLDSPFGRLTSHKLSLTLGPARLGLGAGV